MSNMPMAINTSIANQNNLHLIEIPKEYQRHLYCLNFLVDIEHQAIESNVAYLLGISNEWCTKYIGGDDKYIKHQVVPQKISDDVLAGIHGRFGCIRLITLDQLKILWDKAQNNRSDVYKPVLAELILTQVLPLFNKQSQKHDDFKERAIMTTNQLINIQQQEIDGQTVNAVSARELWKFLESKRKFTDWVKPYIIDENDYGFIENVDFIAVNVGVNRVNQQVMIDYWFTIDMAKEVSMLSKTEKGKQARKYFIDCERRANNPQPQIEHKSANTKSYIGNASLVRLALKEVNSMNLSDDSKQVLKAHLLHDHAGLPLNLMLPTQYEEKLSPEEIGNKLGVSANKVGRIITSIGLRGDERYCERRLNKAAHSDKQVESYFYNQRAIDLIKSELEKKAS